MAPRAKPDTNVMFLYMCLRSIGTEGASNIDFKTVAEATGLNVPAARMRFYRLRTALEPQIVDGKVDLGRLVVTETGESSEAPSAAPSPQKPRGQKRKKLQKAVKTEDDNTEPEEAAQ